MRVLCLQKCNRDNYPRFLRFPATTMVKYRIAFTKILLRSSKFLASDQVYFIYHRSIRISYSAVSTLPLTYVTSRTHVICVIT